MHGERIQIIVAQILMHASVISFRNQLIPILLGSLSRLVMAGAAYTAAFTDHSFDEVLRQPAHLQQSKSLLALRNAAASGNLDIGVLSGLLEALQNSLRTPPPFPKRFPNTLAS